MEKQTMVCSMFLKGSIASFPFLFSRQPGYSYYLQRTEENRLTLQWKNTLTQVES